MAQKSGKTVYRLNESLRVPSKRDPDAPPGFASSSEKYVWLPAGQEATEDELEGLNLPALEQGGFIEKLSEAKGKCEACQNEGTAADKKKAYALEELQGHYREKHPALVPPEEVTSG